MLRYGICFVCFLVVFAKFPEGSRTSGSASEYEDIDITFNDPEMIETMRTIGLVISRDGPVPSDDPSQPLVRTTGSPIKSKRKCIPCVVITVVVILTAVLLVWKHII